MASDEYMIEQLTGIKDIIDFLIKSKKNDIKKRNIKIQNDSSAPENDCNKRIEELEKRILILEQIQKNINLDKKLKYPPYSYSWERKWL